LSVDNFALFFQYLFIAVAAAVIIASQDTVSRFRGFVGEYYGLILFSTSGLMLLASTRELITIYLSLELSTLSAIALVAFFKDGRSTESAIKYLILSAVSSAVMLYGMALVLGVTGSTELGEIGRQLPVTSLSRNPALLLGVVFIIAGFGFKISSFPFQMWVPDVYQGAPTPVTAFLAVASKAAGFAVVLRVFYTAFNDISLDWSMLFAILAIISMSLGNLVAMFQSNLKRLLAYSAIAHAGYIMIGLAAVATRVPGGDNVGPQSVLFYLGGYAFTNLAAFFVVNAIANRIGKEEIDDLAGLGRRSPWMAAILAIALASLTGLPPTVGFWAKLYLFNAAIKADLVWLAVAGAINGAISAYYYLRIIKVMYMSPAPSEERIPSSFSASTALLITVPGILFFGFAPWYLLDFAVRATATFAR
ncbi:MAG: NADH-quinone oxidoreductase subunit N, partial [Chloroflexi bacterium]|nr:NADH-quinone oxidoreductase subunit N [Chloroflexota bacterium]